MARLHNVLYRAEDLAFRALLGLIRWLPYPRRVALMGWLMARIIAPLAGYDRRVRANLAHVWPELPQPEVRRLMRAVPDNVGRTLAEMYSADEFLGRLADASLEGPGVAALHAAKAANRPIVIVTGHFGNYLAPRAALQAVGLPTGALYNPMKNPYFNEHYVAAMAQTGENLFARDRAGYAQLLRYLRAGGTAALLIDQFMAHGAALTFFGKPAPTALSAAELALRYDALFIPIYGVRQPDGISFRLIVENPIAHSDAHAMTQAANDSLEAITRRHPEQWFWIHRRWKPARQARMATRPDETPLAKDR
ncbi:MAG: lauroyl acyltransferase [Paracoccaceae bacterium]